MLRRLSLAGRLLALVVVGVSTFTEDIVRERDIVMDVIALSVAVVALAAWSLSDFSCRVRERLAQVQPFLLGIMAITSGWASLTGNGGAFSLLSVTATISAGATLGTVAACGLTGLAAVAVLSAGLAYGASAFATFGYPLILALGLSFGLIMREHRQSAEQSSRLLANAEQLRDEQARAAALEERNRIAREIHDLLAHSLGALGVQIQAAQAVLADQRDIDRAVDLLGQARRTAAEGLEETRRALYALRSGTPPLAEALAQLSAGHARHYGAPVNFQVGGSPRRLSADAGLALARTAQEALVNTAKHAPREPVDMRLDFAEGQTTLVVANRQAGPASAVPPGLETANGGYGLAGLRERLLLIKGSLSAGPDGGGNWVVTAQVPQ